jgi:glucose-1-phosphate cytidylyltransferase
MMEETETLPKPMVPINGKPMLWHLMNLFSLQGINDFVLALGYKGEVIKRWILDLHELDGDLHVNVKNGGKEVKSSGVKNPWNISALETGLATQTGGRIKRCTEGFFDETFLVTYGDGIGNINLTELIAFHKSHGKIATLTAVRPPARFGGLTLGDNGMVLEFGEKDQLTAGWINGGFFVFNRAILDFLEGDNCSLEFDVLPRLAAESQLMAFLHAGFWKPMDTLREKNEFSALAALIPPPWLEIT